MEKETGERFMVRLADEELEVEGLDALLSLARSSRLSPTTRVRREGQEEWILAERIPALRLHFSADSWDGLEGIQLGRTENTEAPPELVDLPPAAIEMMSEPLESLEEPSSVEDLPTEALESVGPQMVIHSSSRSKRRRKGARDKTEDFASLSAPAPISTSGELIEFPVGSMDREIDDLNPMIQTLERLGHKSEEAPPRQGSRWGGLAFFGLLMFGGIGLMSWYLSTSAQARYPEVPDEPILSEPEDEALDDDFAQLEIELREALARRSQSFDLSRGPQVDKIDQDQRIGEAIAEDLQFRMNISAGVQVIADVLSFKNGADRMPREIGLQITLGTTSERLDHDLGAVGLVVGRLITDFNLEMVRSTGLSNHFKVVMRVGNGSQARQLEVDWREAHKLYRQRLSLEDFLSAVR